MANCKCLWSQFMEFRCNKKVIRQKCESQNRCFEKTKQAKFSEKRKFLSPWYALVSWFLWRRCTRVAVNMQLENFEVFFLSTSDARKHILSTMADSVFFIHETFLTQYFILISKSSGCDPGYGMVHQLSILFCKMWIFMKEKLWQKKTDNVKEARSMFLKVS